MSHDADQARSFVAQDDLRWLWGHAESVRRILDLGALLRRGARSEITDYLRALPGRELLRRKGEVDRVPLIFIPTAGESRQLSLSSTDYTSMANEIVNAILNANVSDLRCVVVVENTRPTLALASTAPIAGVYWHLAVALDDERIRRCESEDCGNNFAAIDNRQRFCGDPCAGRARKRKQRRK